MANKKLAILESEWFSDHRRDASVLAAFQMLTRLDELDAGDVLYERFVGEASFKESVAYFAQKVGVRWFYIASHGDNKDGERLGQPYLPEW